MPVQRALATLESDHPAATQTLQAARHRVSNGLSFAAAAKTARMSSPLDDALLSAAESAGRLGPSLARLSLWYEARVVRTNKIRNGLVFPALVLTLAAFAQPLPKFMEGSLTLVLYLVEAGRILLVFALSLATLGWIYRTLQQRQAHKTNALDRLRLALPLFGRHHRRIQMLSLLSAFEMLYTAGLPPDQAISIALRVLSNGCIRASFSGASAAFSAGKSITEVLTSSPHLSGLAHELVKAGEAAGTVGESLQRYEAIESEEVAQSDQAFADWTPRLVYALVAGWMVSTLF